MIMMARMARPVSEKVRRVDRLLRDHIEAGGLGPGERFPSTRAIARRHDICYQTAHRIVTALVAEGLLEARRGAGTFVAGAVPAPTGVLLLFHPRAKRPQSFGARLKALLEAALEKAAIPYATSWSVSQLKRRPGLLPVYWESQPTGDVRSGLTGPKTFALLLNDRRIPGIGGSCIDTISTDDYSGGVCAAEVLLAHKDFRERAGLLKRAMVLAAHDGDARSRDRIAGFRSLLPIDLRRVVHAGSWNREDGWNAAPLLFSQRPTALFCCNDRLAEGVIGFARAKNLDLPPIVGFDNAPVAEELNLTTIAIPWQEVVDTAVEIIKTRMAGCTKGARRQILAPTVVIRTGPY